jgi:drug/metabolite transporter (DMT)-like permease
LSVFDLLLLRFGIGSLFALPLFYTKIPDITPRLFTLGICLALLHGVGMAGVSLLGLMFAPPSHQAILGPPAVSVWAVVFGTLFFKQSVGRSQWIGITVIAVGIMTIFLSHSNKSLATTNLVGSALFIVAGAMGGFSAALLHRLGLDPRLTSTMVTVFSFCMLAPICVFEEVSLFKIDFRQLVALAVYFGILCGWFVVYAVHTSIRLIGAQRASAFDSMVPVLGMLFSALIGREELGLPVILSCLLVAIGVYLVASKRWDTGDALKSNYRD